MLRRNVRLRKEYLYNKSKEEQENAIRLRKKRIKEAIEKNQPLAPEDKGLELKLRDKLDLETDSSLKPVSVVDDEYSFSEHSEPKILITSARNPSTRLVQFVKELNLLFPNSLRINRGAYVLNDLVNLSQRNNVTDILVVHENRGVPDSLIVSHMPLGPTVYFSLKDVYLRHDLPQKAPPMSTVNPNLIFENLTSPLGERITKVLQHLFPKAPSHSQRVLSFINVNDEIEFRHHCWNKLDVDPADRPSEKDTPEVKADKLEKSIELLEVGPRFTLKPYKIELGILNMKDLEVEWALRTYINKSKPLLTQV